MSMVLIVGSTLINPI
uniref:Uncharacterized protein n=1 Tax=Rhizophora mucronata TaxID=61149 RepID=A0A2P2IV78_RHIMU